MNEQNPHLPCKERFLGCEFDGPKLLLDTLNNPATAPGAALFFFTVVEAGMEDVSEQVVDEAAMDMARSARAAAEEKAAAERAERAAERKEGDPEEEEPPEPAPLETVYKTVKKATPVNSLRIKCADSFTPAVSSSPKSV
jgi:hypothetical protein